MIFGIDPGNTFTGYAVLDKDLRPTEFAKMDNEELLIKINNGEFDKEIVAIEMIANMGMGAVGKSIFETCVWIGRFIEALHHRGIKQVNYIYRREEKINLCRSMKAKDSNIRQALIDRFGPVGVKANKGWFYKVSKDMWSAVAVGVTFNDMYLKNNINGGKINE